MSHTESDPAEPVLPAPPAVPLPENPAAAQPRVPSTPLVSTHVIPAPGEAGLPPATAAHAAPTPDAAAIPLTDTGRIRALRAAGPAAASDASGPRHAETPAWGELLREGSAAAGRTLTAVTGPIGSRLDEFWARLICTPARGRLVAWLLPTLIILLAAVLRLWNLGFPHALVFDETFYVKDAWTLWHNGYESTWPEGADERFNAGDVMGFTTQASYVVHPPLGKWIIGLGMGLFGAESAWAWRITTALLGIFAVGLIMAVARRLFHSRTLALIAGFLLAIDGHAIVMSRVAILDNSVMVFALIGFYCVLRDRPWAESRLASYVSAQRSAGREPEWGPTLWNRPWVIAAGLAFGATSAVKWSGLYFLAAFGLYLVIVDLLARRRAGLPAYFSAAIVKQGPATALLFVIPAALVYLASWTGWLRTSGGYYRQWAEDPANAWNGLFSWVPTALQSLVHYHQEMYKFHVGLVTPHSYQANPLGWLAMIRPTSMWYKTPPPEDCGAAICSQAITSIANPLIWWVAVAATLYLVYRLTRYMEWQVGLILVGFAAGYLPWLMYTERTVFQFYTIAFEPYLLLALTLVMGLIVGKRTDPRHRRVSGLASAGVFLGLAALLSVFWYPLWTATTVPLWFWQLHSWIPGWV